MSEKETSEEIASIAGRVLGMEETDTMPYRELLKLAKRLAASCLSQREPDGGEDGSDDHQPGMDPADG